MLSTAASGATSGSVRCQSIEFCTASALVMFGLEIETLYVTVRTVAEVRISTVAGYARKSPSSHPFGCAHTCACTVPADGGTHPRI